MKETELAELFIGYLSDYDIFKEVPINGIIDIIAVKGPIITAVEVKCSLNFEVIGQAFKNKMYSHFSYIAVPHPKGHHFGYDICKKLGIGIITMSTRSYSWQEDKHSFSQIVKPEYNRKIYKPKLKDWMKESVAGSQNDRMTAFKNTVRIVEQELIRRGGKSPIKEVLKNVDHHYSSFTSAVNCIIRMCNGGVIKEFYHDKGYIILNKIK